MEYKIYRVINTGQLAGFKIYLQHVLEFMVTGSNHEFDNYNMLRIYQIHDV